MAAINVTTLAKSLGDGCPGFASDREPQRLVRDEPAFGAGRQHTRSEYVDRVDRQVARLRTLL